MQSFGGIPSMATNVFSAYATVAAAAMLFRSIANDIIPEPVKSFVYSFFSRFVNRFFYKLSTHMTIIMDEQSGITRNQIYDAAEIYLATIINPDTERLKATKTVKQNSIGLSMVKDQEVLDVFNGLQLKWQLVVIEPDGENSRFQAEKRYFELTFDKKGKDTILNEYLPFVLSKAEEIKEKERAVKLYTKDCPFEDDEDGGSRGGYWGGINLDHPVTFDKLAMDTDMKRTIIEDLDRFLRRKDYYRKVGKAWKRGYLLYGPPGTGKSSLIAAMANYLKFDVYDLELSSIYSDSELRRLLLCTTNRSILVIEDIDSNSQMHDRDRDEDSESDYQVNTKLTLSGLLNFIDGLWSTCGDERIIIFTTNHKEKLDPALLRPGRMDMHMHMGYCTSQGFDVLALNYLGLHDHPRLFPEIKRLINKVEITPAEVAEHLMRNEDPDLALEGILALLKQKKVENGKIVESVAKEKKNNGDLDKNIANHGKKKGQFERIERKLLKFRKKEMLEQL